MTDEERVHSQTLVYQYLPSRYGMNPRDLRRADAALADTQVAEHQVDAHGISGWRQASRRYRHAPRALLEYDYQVNCLGRNTAANPPTVTDPGK